MSVGYISSKVDFAQEEAMAKELSESDAIYSSNINERIFVKIGFSLRRSTQMQ